MSSPVVTAAADRPMAWAAGEMDRRHISSLLVLGQGPGRLSEASGPPFGILTERDVLRALARDGGVALERPIGDYMSSPVQSLPMDAKIGRASCRERVCQYV